MGWGWYVSLLRVLGCVFCTKTISPNVCFICRAWPLEEVPLNSPFRQGPQGSELALSAAVYSRHPFQLFIVCTKIIVVTNNKKKQTYLNTVSVWKFPRHPFEGKMALAMTDEIMRGYNKTVHVLITNAGNFIYNKFPSNHPFTSHTKEALVLHSWATSNSKFIYWE